MIWTQKRWNAFLGIKSDDSGKQTIATSPIKSEVSQTRSIQYEPKQLQEEDELTEQPEELEEKLENPKVEQESETEDQVNYEEIFQSEDEEDQPEYENAETSDQLLDDQFPLEDEYEDDEVDTTIDQLEEEYQEETEDVGIAYVKSPDEEYVVYEEDIAMEEYSQPAKRKYAKAPKDNQKSFECWIKNCGASFSFRATIVKHMHQTHGIIVDKSMCVKCGEKFENYVDFLAHVKIHTRKTECNVCKMTFISQDKLVSHMKRSHKKNDDEDRNYQCHVSRIEVNNKLTSSNFNFNFVLDLRGEVQAQGARQLTHHLQAFRQKCSQILMQRMPIGLPHATRLKESREVTLASDDQMQLLHLRVSRP